MSWFVVHSSVSSIGFRLQRPVCFALAPGLAQSRTQSPQAPWSAVFFNFFDWLFG